MEFYQWLVPLIALFNGIRIISQYRSKKRLITSTVIWLGFWVFVSVLAILPDLVSFNLASLLGFKNNITAIIFVALGTIFLFIFYLSSITERMEKQLTNIVRKLAIENQELKEELKKTKIELLEKKENSDEKDKISILTEK